MAVRLIELVRAEKRESQPTMGIDERAANVRALAIATEVDRRVASYKAITEDDRLAIIAIGDAAAKRVLDNKGPA
jgi:hypothetical protein